jgi:hypothetical protein
MSSDILNSPETELLVRNKTSGSGFVYKRRKSFAISPKTTFSFALTNSEIFRGPGNYEITIILYKKKKEKISLITNFTIK